MYGGFKSLYLGRSILPTLPFPIWRRTNFYEEEEKGSKGGKSNDFEILRSFPLLYRLRHNFTPLPQPFLRLSCCWVHSQYRHGIEAWRSLSETGLHGTTVDHMRSAEFIWIKYLRRQHAGELLREALQEGRWSELGGGRAGRCVETYTQTKARK